MLVALTLIKISNVQIEYLKKLQKGKSLVHFGKIRLGAGKRLNDTANNYTQLAIRAKKQYLKYDNLHTKLVHFEERLMRMVFPNRQRK